MILKTTDIENTQEFYTNFYTTLFNGKAIRHVTFGDVWTLLEDTVRANPHITINKLDVEKGIVSLSTARSDIDIIPSSSERNNVFSIKVTSKSVEKNKELEAKRKELEAKENKEGEFVSTVRMADALLNYIENNPNLTKGKATQRLDIK